MINWLQHLGLIDPLWPQLNPDRTLFVLGIKLSISVLTVRALFVVWYLARLLLYSIERPRINNTGRLAIGLGLAVIGLFGFCCVGLEDLAF